MGIAVLAPTPQITQASNALDEAIGRFLDAGHTVPPLGRYEAYDEALLKVILVIRDIEAVIALARRDLVLLPSAMVLTRAAYEIAIKALWLLDPEDPMQSEVRWLALNQHSEKSYKRLDDLVPPERRKYGDQLAILKEFNAELAAKLQDMGYELLPRVPSVEQMVKTLSVASEVGWYAPYIVGSQFAHGSLFATDIYRHNFGTMKEFAEYTTPRDWHPCLSLCWFSLRAPAERFLIRSGGDPTAFLTHDLVDKIQSTLAGVDQNGE